MNIDEKFGRKSKLYNHYINRTYDEIIKEIQNIIDEIVFEGDKERNF